MMDFSNLTDPLALILQDYEDSEEEKVEGQIENKKAEAQIESNDKLSKDQILSEVPTDDSSLKKHLNSTKCQNCDTNAWKYKCPKCNFHSCSLECCKSHKEKYSCDGIRSKVKYVPIEQYGYENLMSDYVFLEDISRTIDSAHRYMSDKSEERRKNYRNYLPYSKKRNFNKFKKKF